jgi:hypothetical protein
LAVPATGLLFLWGCGEAARTPEPQAHVTQQDQAARKIVRFLQGDESFESIVMAETVTLHLGGFAEKSVPSLDLADLANWNVSDSAGDPHSLVPPKGLPLITTRIGRHLNCMEYKLSSRVAELAELPHVGTMLSPLLMSSCLESWNMTMVFDPKKEPPTLVAVVYDQWEW